MRSTSSIHGLALSTVRYEGRATARVRLAAMTALALVGAALAGCGGGGGGGDMGAIPISVAAPAPAPAPAASYAIGGTASGLKGRGLVLQNNAGDDLPVAADGPFRFAASMNGGATYLASVKTAPTNPAQTCTVNNAGGSVREADITDISVVCSTNTFAISGQVTGLAGAGLVLQNNAGDDLPIAADGTFHFAVPVASGAAYEITVKAQPAAPSQICSVSGYSGIVNARDVTDVAVVCATRSFTVGGTVSGLGGAGLILQNAGADDLPISSDGAFTFPIPVASGATYLVKVKAQPTQVAQTCTVNNASGPVTDNNVANVVVRCSTHTYPVGGTVTGLTAGNSVVLVNNGADSLIVAANGAFSFQTPVADSSTYSITVGTQPLWQSCVVVNGSGTVSAAVGNVQVGCTNEPNLVTTVAGSGVWGSANGTGTDASFSMARAVAMDASGNLYVADTGNHLVRKITPAGVVTTLAGSVGSMGSADGTGTAATFYSPNGIAVDAGGNAYVADTANSLIRKITPAGVVTTLAGSATRGSTNGTGAAASFYFPYALAAEPNGTLYIADTENHQIRKITSTGVVTTLAGSGSKGSTDGTGAGASFNLPRGVTVDAGGNVYVGDTSNHLIRKITPAGVVTTLAGSGSEGFVNGTGAAASFGAPHGVAVDAGGSVYVADSSNHVIREITPSGVVTTLAGSGTPGAANGPGTAASFGIPYDVAADADGNVYVVDGGSSVYTNQLIRKITRAP